MTQGLQSPVRLRLSRAKGFDLQAVSLATNGLPAVNVARPGRWGNRYRVGPGDSAPDYGIAIPAIDSAEQAVALHRAWLARVLHPDCNPDYLAPLRGHNLACWCALDHVCHADTLLDLTLGLDPGANR